MSRDFTPHEMETRTRETPHAHGPTPERVLSLIRPRDQVPLRSSSGHRRESPRGFPLDLPPPGYRAVLCDRDRGYRMTRRQVRIIIDLGKFRAIGENDLAKYIPAENGPEYDKAIESLVRQGLVRRGTCEGPEGLPRELLTLTGRGHRLLRENRLVPPDQPTYIGFVKSREANHDADLYALYQKELERIEAKGGRVRRVLLDFELKRKLNRDLASLGPQARREIARRHGLTVVGNKIPVPDMQIEYDARDGEVYRVNLELVTEHYRPGHVGEKARAGFALYTPRGEGDNLRRILDHQQLTAEILSL